MRKIFNAINILLMVIKIHYSRERINADEILPSVSKLITNFEKPQINSHEFFWDPRKRLCLSPRDTWGLQRLNIKLKQCPEKVNNKQQHIYRQIYIYFIVVGGKMVD